MYMCRYATIETHDYEALNCLAIVMVNKHKCCGNLFLILIVAVSIVTPEI